MYGIPAKTDLSFFQGRTLEQVCLSEYNVQLNFDEKCSLTVESSLRYQDRDGSLEYYIVRHAEEESAPFQKAPGLLRYLSDTVAAVSWKPDGTLTLQFEIAGTLEIYDDSEQYESWQASDGIHYFII